jgi:NAD(P)-dependent dehydrogenase (short-subunit alcohol dehydrogenase family)
MSTKDSPIAVVTGAGRGIGRAISLALCERGFEVWAVVRRPDAVLALRELAGPSATIEAFVADLAVRDEVLALTHELSEEGRTPDVLVNNAGIAVSAPLDKHDATSLDAMLALNTVAPFLLCQALMPAMAKRGSGRVINIASTAGLKGFRYTSGYCATKHAVVGMTRALALEYASKGVTVNAVCPGWTDTDMVTRSAQTISEKTGRTEAQARESLASMNPLGRFVTPEEVAGLCAYLTSPQAAAITGAVLSVDGGETA